ncbi:MAG: OmpA family protein, partial [Myxococcota bacterium]
DQDGFLDAQDKCPNEPETINNNEDDDGCPDQGKTLVKLETERIVILEKVFFDTNKDTIQPRSYPLLDQVAQVLKTHPELRVRVEGHTDSQGKPEANLDLSDRRANAVRTYLIGKGVDAQRLEARGYGQTRPVDTNKTSRGRENNRRVEFVVLVNDDGTGAQDPASGGKP